MVLRKPLAVRSVVGGESGWESARVGLLVRADVLQFADVVHVELMSGRVVLRHRHVALLLARLCSTDARCLVDLAAVNQRGLRGKAALRLHLVERLWLRGRLERVAFEPLVLFERLGEVSTLATASLVPELRLAMTCTGLVELQEFSVILLLLPGHTFLLLVRVPALFGPLRELITSAVSFRNIIVSKLLYRHNLGRLISPVDLRTVDSTAEHGARFLLVSVRLAPTRVLFASLNTATSGFVVGHGVQINGGYDLLSVLHLLHLLHASNC